MVFRQLTSQSTDIDCRNALTIDEVILEIGLMCSRLYSALRSDLSTEVACDVEGIGLSRHTPITFFYYVCMSLNFNMPVCLSFSISHYLFSSLFFSSLSSFPFLSSLLYSVPFYFILVPIYLSETSKQTDKEAEAERGKQTDSKKERERTTLRVYAWSCIKRNPETLLPFNCWQFREIMTEKKCFGT